MGRQFLIATVAALACSVGVLADEAVLTPQELAAKIDRQLASRWALEEIQPAPIASDSEFVRRVYLDLIGRIPRVAETREFLNDPAPDKRARLIDRLMTNAQFVTHWSNTWRDIILPAGGNQQATFFANNLRSWIEQQVRKDMPYDKMVRGLLTAPMNTGPAQPRPVPQAVNPGVLSYFQAHEFKPENLAASTARVFLGVRLECAQCHDHPFAKWAQTDFWGLAAFYSGMQPNNFVRPVGRPQQPVMLKNPGREIKIPGKEKIVKAMFPTGEPPLWDDGVESRQVLAEWVTSKNNPYFARTAANRLWAQCFGMGLLDPCDDEPTDENPIRHPELLADLTEQFVAHDFDIKYLLRSIMLSQAYQRGSALTHPSQRETQAFARMPVRGLTPEQLFDSLATATGYNFQLGQADPRIVAFNDQSARGQFLNRFALQERRTETQTSILQALALMNGKFVSDATSLRTSNTLAAIADVPFMTLEQKIDALFFAALSRSPRAEERDRLLIYAQRGGAQNDPGAALSDVFWALLNTSEFLLNH
jgi:hypothetical protein